ncbi:phosphoglycerate kinase [Candidatus Saccharibacteria bacterium]|nr:phosphoglycerate kinase [Candidatus Saccharibacteria bacterium]
MFDKKTIRDIPVRGQVVLVRTDYNVPLDEQGNITDDLRIKASLPTIQYLLENGASKVILMSHLGRPEGKREPSMSLYPVAKRLQELLSGIPVQFVGDTCGPDVEAAVEALPKGGVLLLENLRFSPDEEKNSEDYANEIVDSTHADLFVQDGFGVIHRAHASTEAITQLLPSVAGLLLEKEVSNLTAVIDNPEHPLLVIIGGAKVEEKQPMIDTFLPIADQIAVGGKIAADGYTNDNPKVYAAEDFVSDDAGAKLDIGPVSTEKIVEMVGGARTIVWNGLLGKAEEEAYAQSSRAVAEAMGHSGVKTVVGGGDTAGFVENLVASDPSLHFTLISTGGGASLDLLSGKSLPGLDALEDK